MTEPASAVTIALRIPGQWTGPQDLIERLPAGCKLSHEWLVLPNGVKIDFNAMPADDQFAEIFRASCRQPPTDGELETALNYQVNVLLSGPGGSLEAARTMMQAGGAIVRAGGAGVFNDNSGLAHGGEAWLQMAEDGSPDALSFAFAAIVRGRTEIWTMGMQVLGLRDIVMKRTDVEEGGFDIIEVIRYLARGAKPMEDGHILADEDGPRFQAFQCAGDPRLAGSPMHNPFGRLKLVSLRDIAGSN
ncbi:MAG: hypothetical protein SFU86_01565 [Pirellulaceae bacterium]|nr:hypothetical protein [Pirellulaceae bacterium]